MLIGYKSEAVALLLQKITKKKRGKDKEIRKGAVGSQACSASGWRNGEGRENQLLLLGGVSTPSFRGRLCF